jgi:hypothetical protein
MIYIFIGLLFYVLAILQTLKSFRNFNYFFNFFATITLILLASFRDGVGTDWDSYLNFYNNIQDSQRVEIGYSFLNDFFSTIGFHYNIFLFIINLICVGLIISFLRNLEALSVVAVLLFYSDLYLYYNFSGMRQAIAMALTCYAIKYAISRQGVKFFSFVIFASMFHYSAAIFAIAFIVPMRIGRSIYIWFLAFSLVIYEYKDLISDLIMEFTIKNADYYLNNSLISEDVITNYYLGLIKRLIIFLFIFLGWKDLKDKFHFQYIVNLYIIGMLIYSTTYLISPDLGVRLSTYFIILDIVIVSLVIFNSRNVSVRFFLLTLISIVALYRISTYASNPYYEYHFFF